MDELVDVLVEVLEELPFKGYGNGEIERLLPISLVNDAPGHSRGRC
jgi:hypothetical protein